MISEYIPKGHENAVSRSYLRSVTHLTDRRLRKEIAESQEQIYWCNGYFRHKNAKDLPYEEDYLRKEAARAKTMAEKVKQIRAAIYG